MKAFTFGGYRFKPVRQFTETENGLTFHQQVRMMGLENTSPLFTRSEFGLLSGKKPVWDYEGFYAAATSAGSGEVDLFEVRGRIVCPMQNYLALATT